ncbi:MAG: preprotein translocase subunit YajC [Deltaproteobacteria bacterium]|jgi:preprotein translocase subunit YajC|nr:preprotein translocase subunit YajC [Deltaproteobacteria bacterium]
MLTYISFLAGRAYAMAPQQTAEGGQQGGGSGMTFVMMAGFVLILYFFLLRPQKKQQQERQRMLDSIQKGDRIQTAGGLLGVVTSADPKELTVRIAPEVRVKIARTAVAGVQRPGSQETPSLAKDKDSKDKENPDSAG